MKDIFYEKLNLLVTKKEKIIVSLKCQNYNK